MRRQPIFVCPKLLLGTWFLSLTPKADPILDDKAINLSLIGVCPLPEEGGQATHLASPWLSLSAWATDLTLPLFPCRQFPPFPGPKPGMPLAQNNHQ